MLDRMKYINHLNEVVDFGKVGLLINENDFRDYQWTYNSQYDKVTSFDRGITNKTLPIIIYGDNREELANELFEKLEKDVLVNVAGRMYVGDYYLTGYFYQSKKSEYTASTVTAKLSFVTDQDYWIKENPYLFRLNNSAISEEGLGYPYDYPYDFLSPISIQSFNNESFADSNFIMQIYGFVENPAVTIGRNTYRVNTTVNTNEFLTINSKEKTIIRTTAKGEKINEFANRDNEVGYIFQPIPSGTNKVTMSSDFNLDVTILEERSEPKWI